MNFGSFAKNKDNQSGMMVSSNGKNQPEVQMLGIDTPPEEETRIAYDNSMLGKDSPPIYVHDEPTEEETRSAYYNAMQKIRDLYG